MKRVMSGVVLAVLFTLCASAAKPKEEPFAWPALPDAATKEQAAKLKSDTGLVVVQRLCKLQLNSYFAEPYKVKKEEFVRFLVLNEEGAKAATVDLLAESGSVFGVIEGRTIAPDGTITPVDRQKDVKILTAKLKKKSDSEDLGGTVSFPAPVVGALLDLHFTAEQSPDYGPVYHAEALLYDQTTTLKADLELRIKGGLPEHKWNLLSFGSGATPCRLEALPDGGYAARMGTYQIEVHESNTPPVFHTSPFILTFIDFSDIKVKSQGEGVAQRIISWDNRGRVQGITFPAGEPTTKWWMEYIEEDQKDNKEFLKKPGNAELAADAAAIAPADLPLEERLRRLYDHVQKTVKRDPDAERIVYMTDMFKRGANSDWQGTLYYSYLLWKAGISHTVGLVADREAMRYSPLVKNGWIYNFETAVVVDAPGGTPYVLQPGDFSLEFGTLPYDRQEAMVFIPRTDGSIQVLYSPINPIQKDRLTWTYALEMDASGGASGTVTQTKLGAPARGFRRWYVLREIRHKNPEVEEKDKDSEQDRKKELDEELEDAFGLPGDLFTASSFELVKCEQDAKVPLEIQAKLEGKGVGQASGNRWQVAANPLMVGYKTGYNRPLRKNPIWNGAAGRRIVEGELLLPAGAKVLELPKPQEVKGPDGLVARYSVEQLERDGRVVLRSRMEYDVPLIVASNLYASYKIYLDGVARLAQDKCMVELSVEKELE